MGEKWCQSSWRGATPNPYADFNASGSLTTRYLYGPAIDQLFARWSATGGEVDWYLGDILGSVRQIVKTDGTVIDSITYDSFGKILSETNSSNGDRFKYTGREWDAVFEQYYYRARFYGPDIGRFTQEDPISFAGGDVNLYRYVFNTPANLTDPTGWMYKAPFATFTAPLESEPTDIGYSGSGGDYGDTTLTRYYDPNAFRLGGVDTPTPLPPNLPQPTKPTTPLPPNRIPLPDPPWKYMSIPAAPL